MITSITAAAHRTRGHRGPPAAGLRRSIRTSVVALALLLLGGSAAGAQSGSETRRELETRWAHFIDRWEAEDAAGAASLYAPEGVNLSPTGEVAEGREAVAGFYKYLFDQHERSTYSHEILSVEPLGDRDALELGEFKVDWVTNDGDEWQFAARSLTHWRRNAQGEWEIETIMFQDMSEE